MSRENMKEIIDYITIGMWTIAVLVVVGGVVWLIYGAFSMGLIQ